MSKATLGELIGMSAGAITNFEKGFNPIYYEQAVRFGEIFGIETEELLDEYTSFCRQGYGKRICRIRQAYGLSQVKFSELLGTNRSTVSIWEAEIKNHRPKREMFDRLKELAADKGVDIHDA